MPSREFLMPRLTDLESARLDGARIYHTDEGVWAVNTQGARHVPYTTEQAAFMAAEAANAAPPAQENRPVVLPLQRGQTALNRTQIREILAARQVWDRIGVGLRTRINASLQSDGRLFRLTRQQQQELRNALNHARSRSGLNRQLQNLFFNTFTW